jgi:hypothetical protein
MRFPGALILGGIGDGSTHLTPPAMIGPVDRSQEVRDVVRAHCARLRPFFLPKRAPEMNPDEQVWDEIKNHRIGKQPVENKNDLKKRLYSALRSVQKNTGRILSFFQFNMPQFMSFNQSPDL